MKTLLINAHLQPEVRAALIENKELVNFEVETLEGSNSSSRVKNIYKGLITHTEPSLDAAFVDYGASKHGFLPKKELIPSILKHPEKTELNISEQLSPGQEVIVQVLRDERDNKGAALSTRISLAARHLVLKLENDKSSAISRRLSPKDREQMRETIKKLNMPDNCGVIFRTAAAHCSHKELEWDLQHLQLLIKEIKETAAKSERPALILKESDILLRIIRDHLSRDVAKVIIDDAKTYKKFKEKVNYLCPEKEHIVELHEEQVPLFTKYDIEHLIRNTYQPRVTLPSGGTIIFEHTEALSTVDVNSSKSTKGGSLKETALNTNLEAATEIAKQLRFRDIGGLIVIDFIDMKMPEHQEQVQARLLTGLKLDYSRTHVGSISEFGLLEMSRQRLRTAINDNSTSENICHTCKGQGKITTPQATANTTLRLIINYLATNPTAKALQIKVHPLVAMCLLNENRKYIVEIEQKFATTIIILSSSTYEITENQLTLTNETGENKVIDNVNHTASPIFRVDTNIQKPLIKNNLPSKPAPQNNSLLSAIANGLGLTAIWKFLSGTGKKHTTTKKGINPQYPPRRSRNHSGTRNNYSNRKTQRPFKTRNDKTQNLDAKKGGQKRAQPSSIRQQKPKAKSYSNSRTNPGNGQSPIAKVAEQKTQNTALKKPTPTQVAKPAVKGKNVLIKNDPRVARVKAENPKPEKKSNQKIIIKNDPRVVAQAKITKKITPKTQQTASAEKS